MDFAKYEDMIKSLLYKEWLKTRWVILCLVALLAGFCLYDFLVLSKNCELVGYAYLWEYALDKNSVIVDNLSFLPIVCALLLSISQYVPEGYRKCLKLTLHLPLKQSRTVCVMQGYGLVVLVAMFALQSLAVFAFLGHYLVVDLVWRIVLSTLVWYCAGLGVYVWMSAICLEPKWGMKIFEALLLCVLTGLYYLSTDAMAYRHGLLPLFVATVLCALPLIHYSVRRFKDGE